MASFGSTYCVCRSFILTVLHHIYILILYEHIHPSQKGFSPQMPITSIFYDFET